MTLTKADVFEIDTQYFDAPIAKGKTTIKVVPLYRVLVALELLKDKAELYQDLTNIKKDIGKMYRELEKIR